MPAGEDPSSLFPAGALAGPVPGPVPGPEPVEPTVGALCAVCAEVPVVGTLRCAAGEGTERGAGEEKGAARWEELKLGVAALGGRGCFWEGLVGVAIVGGVG